MSVCLLSELDARMRSLEQEEAELDAALAAALPAAEASLAVARAHIAAVSSAAFDLHLQQERERPLIP